MAYLIHGLGFLLSLHLVAGNFSYDGSRGPSHWGNEYKTCLGKYQSPIDIEEKDVTTITYPDLQFSRVNGSHTAYMTNNGHTVMVQSFDPDLPTISGGPLNETYAFQQLHFHWGQSDELGSEDLINNRSYSMELHAVFWKMEYGSGEKAMQHDDGLTVLAYWYQATDKPNPTFDSIVSQISEIAPAGSNVTIKDETLIGKLIVPDLASAQKYFTYKGSLTTPPCLEIVQWIDFVQPQYISHEQLAAFRSIQSIDGTNLTHNFRPVQPLDGRTVYRNGVGAETTSATSGKVNTMVTSAGTIGTSTISKQTTAAPPTTTSKSTKGKVEPSTHESPSGTMTTSPMEKTNHHSGQPSATIVSPLAVILGVIFLFRYQ